MKLKLVEDIINKIEYKSISNIDKFKQYADEILGGYGEMSDSDIKKDIKEVYINGELKGYIGLSKYNEEDGTKLLGIGNFMIIERGKGYGTQVINDIVSKYKNEYDLIYCFVDSDNEGAISLYKKLGKVYDEDGPNDNGQYYVTFYDNGKYKLEESLTEDLNSMLPYYKNLQNEDRNYVLSFLSKDPTWNEKKESGQYSKWILDKLNRKIIDNSILGHLGDLLKRFEDNKKQLKDKDIMKFKSAIDLEDYLNNENNYIDLSHRQEVRQRQKDRHNADLNNEAELVYEDNDWEVWIPKTYAASCKLGQGTSWCTASTETSNYYDNYTSKGQLYININKRNPEEKYQFHFESKSFMDKDDQKINIEEFFIDNPTLYKKIYKDMYQFNIDNALQELSILKKNNYNYYYTDKDKISEFIRDKIKKITIVKNVTNIGENAFYNCTSLTSVEIPNTVTSIGKGAFDSCISLTSIEIPNNIKSIDNFAFVNCTSLTNVIIDNGVTRIGDYAFNDCSSLTNINIPDSVISMGAYVFRKCPSLTIYCEAESKPSGWDIWWNILNWKDDSSVPVVWGYKGNKTNESFQKLTHNKYKLEENYDPPYNAQQIKDNYGIELYNKLIKDPAHRWRMKTGIELIHKEPTKEELERIWKNWQEISEEQKEKSDKKSLELFGKTNEENYYDLIKLYESVDSNKDIDDIETPEQLMIWMEKNISYELANDEYDAEDDPPTKTAEEVIESGTGHCAEQSYLEYEVLDELGYFPQLIFVKENNSEEDYGADGSAHMFVVYQDDDEKYTYFEHSQEHNKGIHKFDSMSELLDFVGKNWWRYDANSDILEVRYIDEPITGVKNWELAQECHKYPVDEVLDISNNVMEDDVPLDAKWDPYRHEIIEKSLTEASFRHSYKTAFGISNQYRGFTVVESKDDIAVYDGLVTDQNLVESNFKSLDDAKLYIDLITGYARKPFNADYKYSIILLLSAGLDEKLKSMIEDGIKLRNISKKSDDLDFYIQIGSKEDNLNNIIKKYDLQDYIVNFRKKSDYSGPQSSQSIKDLLRLGHASRREDAIAYYDNLTEAKKSKNKNKKKKKIDYTEFNTPAKLKAWAKKRQKGLSPFTYLNTNAGNVEYNNSMFNQMMGNNNSNSTTDSAIGSMPGGISNGGLSSGEAASAAGDGGGMAMGESMNLKEAWYRVTCNGGNNFGKASLSFQKPGPDGKFKIGIKSKANFTNGEQVTFKTKEDAQEFAERVLNSDVGKKRGMTKIYEPQVISDSNSERFVEVDTVFGKAYMRPDLAISFGYTVENDNNLILDEITNILENIGYKKINTRKVSDNIIYLFRNDQFISPMGTKIDIELVIPEDIGQVIIRFKHDSAKLYYDLYDIGSNISSKTLYEVKSNLETYIKGKISQSEQDYEGALPEDDRTLKSDYTQLLNKYPFAKKDLEYVLLFD